jgi:hypothetical protein
MTVIHRHRIRHGIVAVLVGALALPVLSAVTPLTASAKTRCTEKIKGPNNTPLAVASGEMLCLVDAQQTGDITVASGGKLKVVRSTVNGGITLASGFIKFKFCKSEQTGGNAISATGGTKPVLIGGTKRCGGNTISGAVNLTSNGAGVKMGKNQITGVVTANSNQAGLNVSRNTIGGAVNADSNQAGLNVSKNTIGGAVTLTANIVRTLLSDNQITGALNCSTNDPEPTNGGSPNDVEGARSGQCEGDF